MTTTGKNQSVKDMLYLIIIYTSSLYNKDYIFS